MKKNNMQYVRLLLGANQAEQSRIPIAEEFLPRIAEARDELRMMHGSDVLDAIAACQRSGLQLTLDVRQRGVCTQPRAQERRAGKE